MLTTSWCADTIHLADILLNFTFPFIYANHKRVGALSYADSTSGMQALDQLSASSYHCLQRQPLPTPTTIIQLLPLIQVQAAVVFTIPTLPRRIKGKAVPALAEQYLSRKGVVERWSQQQPVVKVRIPLHGIPSLKRKEVIISPGQGYTGQTVPIYLLEQEC